MFRIKRTIKDKFICFTRTVYYRIYEYIRLRYERWIHRNDLDFLPLISIITPTYNRGDILQIRAIPSVLNQTYKNWEWIIVSDGSIDNTRKIIETLNEPRIRYYEIERKQPHHKYNSKKMWYIGGTNAANFALSKIKGKWIARLDDDDMWSKTHLEELIMFAIEKDYDFVSCAYDIIKEGKKQKVEPVYFKSPYFYPKKKGINLDSPLIGGHSCWLYRSYLSFMKYNKQCWRKSWNKVDDTDLSLRMYQIGMNIGFLDKILTHVYPRPGELTIGFEAVRRKIENDK